ncbi:MAG: alpha/beta fold hydrolase [Microcella sp.]|uniref:alpha/beta hydrolase n=1 Tax=Microcella sp. TaxID=1913979 RepID=UPI003314F1FE
MATIDVDSREVAVRLRARERVFAVRGDIRIPLAHLASVEVVSDAYAAMRGLRAPGLGLPGYAKVGTWRRRSGSTVGIVWGRGPGLRLTASSGRVRDVVVSLDDADAAHDRIRAALAGRPTASALRVSAAVELAGELVMPADARAIAVLLPGSGPLDRDGDARGLALGIQRELSESLADHRIASMRWDKRGVGESSGDFLASGLHDLVDDACAVVDHALEHGLPVIVIGHSEGTAIAARVAVERPAIAGAVLLSGYARSGLEVLRWQSRMIAADIPGPVRFVLRALRTDLEKATEKNRTRLLATTKDVERMGGVRVNARWYREFMAYDPSDDLAAAAQPMFALGGEYDLQSPPEDTPRIAELRSATTRAAVLDGLSHILRTQPSASLRTYRRDARRPVDPRIAASIVEWIGTALEPRAR